VKGAVWVASNVTSRNAILRIGATLEGILDAHLLQSAATVS